MVRSSTLSAVSHIILGHSKDTWLSNRDALPASWTPCYQPDAEAKSSSNTAGWKGKGEVWRSMLAPEQYALSSGPRATPSCTGTRLSSEVLTAFHCVRSHNDANEIKCSAVRWAVRTQTRISMTVFYMHARRQTRTHHAHTHKHRHTNTPEIPRYEIPRLWSHARVC